MQRKYDDLSSFVAEEVEGFRNILNKSLYEDKPFDYLRRVAVKYRLPEILVFNESLDIFNYYISNGASPKKAVRWSLEKVHEEILRKYLD